MTNIACCQAPEERPHTVDVPSPPVPERSGYQTLCRNTCQLVEEGAGWKGEIVKRSCIQGRPRFWHFEDLENVVDVIRGRENKIREESRRRKPVRRDG